MTAVRTVPATLAAIAFAVTAYSTPADARKKGPPPGFEPAMPAPTALPPATAPAPSDGAIFQVRSGYSALHQGNRATKVGDMVTIHLIESIDTSKSAASNSKRQGGFSITPPTAGLLSFLNPNALKSAGQSSFKGQGDASQSSTLSGEIAVTIAEVRSNGTAFVRGEKRMMLSQGLEWVQFSGIVRLIDIDINNAVASSQVADARIEYSGKGSVQRASREGWLSRFFNAISPF